MCIWKNWYEKEWMQSMSSISAQEGIDVIEQVAGRGTIAEDELCLTLFR
jgi:hypothetical protein